MWQNPHFPADLVIFSEEILNGKLQFSCSVCSQFDASLVPIPRTTLKRTRYLKNYYIHENIVSLYFKGIKLKLLSSTTKASKNTFSFK